MAVRVAIIGLGQIGASIGMALGQHEGQFERIGHDIEMGIARQAQKRGAVDKININLPSTVEKADIVILALPSDQIRETVEIIAQDLKPESIVMDTAPLKEPILALMKELLPEKCHYIGLTPVLNPKYLTSPEVGVNGARADLFQRGIVAVVTPSGVSSDAVRLATDFVRILGSEHLFIDAVEVDSQMALLHWLPQLTASALLQVTAGQPGWQEGKKMAGRPYTEATGPVMQSDEPQALAYAAVKSGIHMTRVIDTLIATLTQVRSEIDHGNEDALRKRFADARDARIVWWSERGLGQWSAVEMAPQGEIPTSREWISRLFFGSRSKK